jgi:hypothetical protein
MKRSKLPSAARLRFLAKLTRNAERERKLLALAEALEEEEAQRAGDVAVVEADRSEE